MNRFIVFLALLSTTTLLAAGSAATAELSPEPIKTSVTANGLVADLYTPADARGRLPAIIVLGGSEGGMGSGAAKDARLIAQHGYAALQVAYFDAPGLPKTLEAIPLEYFKSAIDYLRAQPGVDPERIGIEGTSIGGEAVLVIASHYPEIKAVVAAVPSSVVWPGISTTNFHPGSTWTLGGQPLPDLPYGAFGGASHGIYGLYANGLKAIDQHPDAVIPVEKINGPVMLICGKSDELWPSCPMSEQVADRLEAKHFHHKVQLLAYENAGHAAFGQPTTPDNPFYKDLASIGGTSEGNNAARMDDWPRAMAFMDAALKR